MLAVFNNEMAATAIIPMPNKGITLSSMSSSPAESYNFSQFFISV